MTGRRWQWGTLLTWGAILLGSACAGNDGGLASPTTPSGSSPEGTSASTTSPVTTPALPAVELVGDAVVSFDLEIEEAPVAQISATATAVGPSEIEVGGYWMIERWADGRWVAFARFGDTPSMDDTIPICPVPDGAEECTQSLESRLLAPNQHSIRQSIAVEELPPGAYRVRLDGQAEAVSDHLVVGDSGLSVADWRNMG